MGFQARAHQPWPLIIDNDSYLKISRLISHLSLFDQNKPFLVADFVNWPAYYSEMLPDLTSQLLGKNLIANSDDQLWPCGEAGLVFTKPAGDALLSLFDFDKKTNHPVLISIKHNVWLPNLLESAP